MDTANLKIFESSFAHFAESLSTPQFYLSMFGIGLAVSVAWLMAFLIQKRVRQRLREKPPQKIDAEFIIKPLSLLGPLLGIIYLNVAKPFIYEYGSKLWVDAAVSLTLAYLFAKMVILILGFRAIGYFIATLIMLMAGLEVSGLLATITAYLEAISFTLGKFKLSMLGIIKGIISLVIVFWAAGALSKTLESYLRRSSSLSYNARELTVTFFKIFLYFVALLITLSYADVDLTAFAVFGGALGVGLGLGLQKIASNFISGVGLLMEKSVQVGDLVQLGEDTGWVRQLNIRYMLIETFDGREIFIPNEDFANSRVTNWTHSSKKARVTIPVTAAYGSNPQQVIDILVMCASLHARCTKDPAPAAVLREFAENGLNFELTFWVDDVREGRYNVQSDVMIAVLEKFKDVGIDIPYPQRVVHIKDKLSLQSA
ncbi:MAG: mechanosensitive ion channel family protein [Alphaproteobacteria bacterium]